MKKIIAMVCTALFIATLSLTAFADAGINNSILGETGAAAPIPVSGEELIRQTGDRAKISMPNYKDYFDNPAVRYVDAPKNHSIYVYKDPDTDLEQQIATNNLMPAALEGLKVLAVARHSGMYCIVYQDRNFKMHAGWAEIRHLVGAFPGKEITVGNAYTGISTEVSVPRMSWSRDPFVDTNHRFVYFQDSAADCVQFKLAYQVTNAEKIRFNDSLGLRTIYVNDGSGWINAGTFDYKAQGTVLVTVNLENAMDLKAVAVIPTCKEPDGFIYRIEIQNLSAGE